MVNIIGDLQWKEIGSGDMSLLESLVKKLVVGALSKRAMSMRWVCRSQQGESRMQGPD